MCDRHTALREGRRPEGSCSSQQLFQTNFHIDDYKDIKLKLAKERITEHALEQNAFNLRDSSENASTGKPLFIVRTVSAHLI